MSEDAAGDAPESTTDAGSEQDQTDSEERIATDSGPEEPELPDDLRPDEDNPLARHPEETGEESDVIGDSETEPERAPMTAEDADYGGAGGGGDGGDGDSSE